MHFSLCDWIWFQCTGETFLDEQIQDWPRLTELLGVSACDTQSCYSTEKGIFESSAPVRADWSGSLASQLKSFIDSWETSAVGMSQCSGKNKNITVWPILVTIKLQNIMGQISHIMCSKPGCSGYLRRAWASSALQQWWRGGFVSTWVLHIFEISSGTPCRWNKFIQFTIE